MSVVDELKAVKELLSDRKRWTQHTSARDKHSQPVDPQSDKACRWCLSGALVKVRGSRTVPSEIWNILADAAGELAGTRPRFYDFIDFNDEHSHSDVLRCLDLAIATAEKEQAEGGGK